MSEFNIGTIVPFGGYHWHILDIQGNAALIITDKEGTIIDNEIKYG